MRHRVGGGDASNGVVSSVNKSRSTVLRRRMSRERATVKDATRFLYQDPAWRR